MAFSLRFFLLLAIFSSSCLNSQAKITYADYCSSIVPQSSFSSLSEAKSISIHLSNVYFTGGDKFFSSPSSSSSSENIIPGRVSFFSEGIYGTKNPNIYHLSGSLYIEGESSSHSNWWPSFPNDLRSIYMGGNSFSVDFRLSGFWSKSTGKLCMVGTGSSYSRQGKQNPEHSVMYTVNHQKDTNITNTIVRGMIKSVDIPASPNHFDTISILGYHKSKNYSYTKITAAKAMCSTLKVPTESIGFENHEMSDYINYLSTAFRLEYGKDCSSNKNCIFPLFSSSQKNVDVHLNFMTASSIASSEDGKVTMVICFSNSSYYNYESNMVPGKSLVAEGYWDSNKKILCVLACPLLVDLSIGKCTFGLSFRFPSVFTVKDRANVLGRIWSTKGKNEPGYFNTISLRSLENTNKGFVPSVKYKYTKLDSVEKNCKENNHNHTWTRRYPNGNALADLNFDILVITQKNHTMRGYAVPLAFDDEFFADPFLRITTDVSFSEIRNYFNHSSYNVSYLVWYSNHDSFAKTESKVDISAEGIYNSLTGKFCMVGCKSPSHNSDDHSHDCEIQIDIQLSPYNLYENSTNNTGIRHLVDGTIVSTRKKSDPLYFEPLMLSSYTMYNSEFRKVVERMDVEIIFVLVSLTLMCIFILTQIFYVRKHKNVLPSISIIMLVILIIGHVIPLLPNFEAMFENWRSGRNVMLWSGGWIDVNEVVVTVLTLVAFLLQMRLLQITWDNTKDHKLREMKVLKFLLPFYFGGALISWLIQRRTFSSQDAVSYCGLILDGFLLPQIIFNFIVDSKEKALAPIFYMGTTAVRVLPHLYDAYRARNNVPYSEFSYIYASKDSGYFSSTWDFVIIFGGTLLAVLVFLQQKHGGSYLIPNRFRKNVGYVTVPVINL